MSHISTVAILDCGSQYTKVIDRKIREMKVRSEILSVTASTEELSRFDAIILSGGPASVYGDDKIEYNDDIFNLQKPILSICYGMQLVSDHFGGKVESTGIEEYGQTNVSVDLSCPLFHGLDASQVLLMSHGDTVTLPPPGFQVVAKSQDIIAAIASPERNIFCLQFHPEVDLSENGLLIIKNFLFQVAKLEANYLLTDRIETSIQYIRERVSGKKVFCLVSGGVDSAVTAALLVKALDPDDVYAIHVDTGLMRKNESDQVCKDLEKLGLKHLIRRNAQHAFFHNTMNMGERVVGPMVKTVDPEDKRHLCGDIFIQELHEICKGFEIPIDEIIWGQGTLRPDLIESGNPDVSSVAHKIKTHHNDVDIVRKARAEGRVIETNWDWHKDEVRQVARELGISQEIASRQPFPGPGLCVRVICNDDASLKREPAEQLIFNENKAKFKGLESFSGGILPVKTVGVQGDRRSYSHLGFLASESTVTDWESILRFGSWLPGKLKSVNRMTFLLNKPRLPSDLKFHEVYINEETVEVLQEVDHIVTTELKECPNLSQYFAVLLPFAGGDKKYSVGIRAFVTNDFMTGKAGQFDKDIPYAVIQKIVNRIESLDLVDCIFYDITSKPPATVEWQ